MAFEIKKSNEARNGSYLVTYYCYNDKCPIRTEKEPWPRSDGEFKYVNVTSKHGNIYRRKRWVCIHCGEVMSGTASIYDFD